MVLSCLMLEKGFSYKPRAPCCCACWCRYLGSEVPEIIRQGNWIEEVV